LVGEVGRHIQHEAQRHRLLREVREIDVFMQAFADKTREPQLDGLLRRLVDRCGCGRRAVFGLRRERRKNDVIAEP
jgi:hypothetical protein